MTDTETTARIDSGATSVRVMFTIDVGSPGEVQVYGVFRIDDDSEVDFDGLPLDEQNGILSACESATKETK